MKIVLLNTCAVSRPKDRLQRVDPHLRVGVAVIAACLRRAGHAVRVSPVGPGCVNQFAGRIENGCKDIPRIPGGTAGASNLVCCAPITALFG